MTMSCLKVSQSDTTCFRYNVLDCLLSLTTSTLPFACDKSSEIFSLNFDVSVVRLLIFQRLKINYSPVHTDCDNDNGNEEWVTLVSMGVFTWRPAAKATSTHRVQYNPFFPLPLPQSVWTSLICRFDNRLEGLCTQKGRIVWVNLNENRHSQFRKKTRLYYSAYVWQVSSTGTIGYM